MNSLQIKFYCRKCKVGKDGTAKIEMSVNYGGNRKIITLPRRCSPLEFTKKDVKSYLSVVEGNVWNVVTDMTRMNMTLTTESICDIFQNGFPQEKVYTVEDLFIEYWEYLTLKDKAGKFTLNNWMKYTRARDKFFEFIGKDKALEQVCKGDIERWMLELTTIGYKSGTIGQYLSKVKTVFLYAIANGKTKVNPFYGIKLDKGGEKIEIITDSEYNKIMNKVFATERINKVRDMFIFSCNSGLAYCDCVSLQPEDFTFVDGRCVIHKTRQKTGVEFYSVVLPDGIKILEKYNFDLNKLKMSNQKTNEYLKTIQDLCEVKSVPSLHFHLARHWYCTALLRSGVPTSIARRCTGHSSERMLNRYTHLLANDIVNIVSKHI